MDIDKKLTNDAIPSTTDNFKTVGVEFSGKFSEFFPIWIVNVLLSIITLGIYSAWATVRTKSYFYGNTKIDGHVFSYLAKPMQILRGRILAIILVVVYSILTQYFPILGMILAILLFILTPWIIVQSLRFNNRMISYRNVRFDFRGSYGDAFIHFLLLPIVALLTVYLAMPWVMKKINQYVLSNTTYGETTLVTNIKTAQFYKTYLLILLAIIGFIGATFAIIAVLGSNVSPQFLASLPASTMLLVGVFYMSFFALIRSIALVQIRNHIFNNSEFIGLASFKSTLEIKGYAILEITNLLALICSLGIAYPWVAIRSNRYLAKHVQVEINLTAAHAIDTKSEQNSAFGVEAAEAFDMGVSVI
ncbi:MAG: YjgN family protein [Oceanospirillaceae bacterium]